MTDVFSEFSEKVYMWLTREDIECRSRVYEVVLKIVYSYPIKLEIIKFDAHVFLFKGVAQNHQLTWLHFGT